MRSLVTRFIPLIASSVAVLLLAGTAAAQTPSYQVLVFSKTAGFRHKSIPVGVEALQALGARQGFGVEATEDSAAFTPENLRRFAAVVFLNTTGDVLNPAQEAAFEGYIRQGGGFVGIHAAADTEYEWPFYGELVGAYFESHPKQQTARIVVADRTHPSTKHLPARWDRFDEWYNYKASPRGNTHVLMALDEGSYEGGKMGHDHPIAWAHRHGGGRAWYTGLGHTDESYREDAFLQHVLGGIQWAAGRVEAEVGATETGAFEKVVLVEDVTDPIELAVAPDGRVFFIERGGAVRVWDPATERAHMVGFVPVSNLNEDGLLGLTLDPNFAQNGWIYLYYSPVAGAPRNELARFTVRDGRMVPGSQRVMLDVPTQREECCHTGGSLAFGPDGSLYLSTGDNTNPFASDGFAPIDERPGREPWDAQRTSGNTDDLRGKILRIQPRPDGSYTIPEGNLFPGGRGGRPEIYVMGNRNPYRISVDARTGWLYWGEVGPDAAADNEERGPAGHDEINQARQAGNYGWPLFVADNKPYRDYNFTTKESGAFYDPQRPVNESPNNTGARVLPPTQPALIWYPYGPSEAFPAVEAGGRTAMAGPVYHYDAARRHPNGLPAYYDNTLFFYEWARNWIKEVKLDEGGQVLEINSFMPEETFIRPMDMELGPDGRLYVIEWGPNFWGNHEVQRIVRLDYHGGPGRPPVADVQVTPTSGPAPLAVRFDASGSRSPNEGAALQYAWDFDGDGGVDSSRPDASYTYATPGAYTARLTITDDEGRSVDRRVPVTVGNTAPRVSFTWPVNGGFFRYGEAIPYAVTVADPDESVREGAVVVQPYYGQDTHTLALQPRTGPKGSVTVYEDQSYEYKNGEAVLLTARYTDAGAAGTEALTGEATVVLHPMRKQAEFASALEGAVLKSSGDIRKKTDFVTFLQATNGGNAAFEQVNLHGIERLTFRVKPEAGGRIEVRVDAPAGRKLAEVQVPSAEGLAAAPAQPSPGGVETHDEMMHRLREGTAPKGWTDLSVPLENPGGAHTLYLVFTGPPEGTLLNLDWIEFDGPGIMQAPAAASK